MITIHARIDELPRVRPKLLRTMGTKRSEFRAKIWQALQYLTSNLKTARNVVNRCSRKNYIEQTIRTA